MTTPRPAPARPETGAARGAITIFLAFAFAYFISALLRAVTATLAPTFSGELDIGAADLGLLAGAYFLGFALMQLPLGQALDRYGPRRVLLSLLLVAIAGCCAFALARSLFTLVLARATIGVGVSACLMAPLTCYRRVFSPSAQLRANSWMLMTGSLGMMASTLPVQWLLPVWGWRGLFWVLAGLLVCAAVTILWLAPADPVPSPPSDASGSGYRDILRHPMFLRMAPLGFFVYGGLIAVQALWAGPWLTRVAGWSDTAAASGLLAINACMLLAFMGWGALLPRWSRRGIGVERLMIWGLPASLLVLCGIVVAGPRAGAWAWALWCVCSSFVTLSQPAVGQAFPVLSAGRALSAFNLVIFAGVFVVQWGVGWCVDLLTRGGVAEGAAFQWAFGIFAACCVVSYLWFVAAFRRANIMAADTARN